ncbi:MAG: FKBP-type peptidyl-prolyl cis-trans isomerase [Candidatus Omnitrophota bacterium]
MKKFMFVLMIALLIISVNCSKSEVRPEKVVDLKVERQKVSYAVGYDLGTRIKEIADELDMDTFYQGIRDAAVNNKQQIVAQDRDIILRAFSQKLTQKFEAKRKVQGEKNKAEGQSFLKENAKKPGVKVTPSGLQYIVMEEGKGEMPKLTDRVKVHYKGTLLDGSEFDSSYKRGQPAIFELSKVIPGWSEGLQLMKVGSRYKFFIPSDLAYKEMGAGAVIGPNAVLIFEVQLLSIEPPEPTASQPATQQAAPPKPRK